MVEVIETNLFADNDNKIYDHQSRIIEVEDWNTYCNAFEKYDGRAVRFKSKQMPGNSIQANRKIKELLYDDYHLSCTIYDDVYDDFIERHFAYKMRTCSQQVKDQFDPQIPNIQTTE